MASTVHESLVVGFARVRKCTPEGRAGMALDVQVLHGRAVQVDPGLPGVGLSASTFIYVYNMAA